MQRLTTKQKLYLVRLHQCIQRQPNPRFDVCIALTQLADAVFDAYSNVLTNVKRLETAQLLKRSENSEVGFRAEGLTLAHPLIYRWHVVEAFLVNVMSLQWDEVENEVVRLYNTGSDRLINRMWKAAGSPQFSPFGEPIDPTLPSANWTEHALHTAPAQQRYTITRIITRDTLQLNRLDELRLLPGQTLHLLDRRAQTGTVQLRIAHEQYVLDRTLAEGVLVRES